MPDSIPIPLDLLAETRAALDAAVRALREPEVYTKVMRAREKIDEVIGGSCANISTDKRQEGYQMLRHLDEVRRRVRKDYGLEK